MKKQIMKKTILSTAVALSISSISLSSFAVDEDVMVITANRITQNINDTLAAVEVITREDIERIQPESITDLLTTIAGFDFTFNGGAGQTSATFTRGTNSDHTLILVDGIRVGSATSGSKSFSTIPVAQIERIEVVKGPRAALWGSDAIGGVVHIFTRRLDAGEYAAALTGGSDKYIDGSVVFGFGNQKLKNTVTLSHTKSDGFDVLDDGEIDEDGYRRTSFSFRGDYQLSDNLALDWVAQVDKGNSEFDNQYGGDQADYDNYFWNIRYSFNDESWLTQFAINQSRDESLTYSNDPDKFSPKASGSLFATTREQINLITQYLASEIFTVAAGFERYQDDVADTENLVSWDPELDFSETKQTTQSVFASSNLMLEDIIGELSLRHDEVEDFDSNKSFNLSLGYKLFKNSIISISRSKGFKAPTFNELYYPDVGYFQGNTNLVAEVSFNNELLFKSSWNNHSISISSYENKIDNLIAYDAGTLSSININKANLKGQELVYRYRGGSIGHKFSASLVSAKDLSIDFLTGEPKNTQLQRRAKKHFSYEINADINEFSIFSQINYTGKRPDIDYNQFVAVNLKSFTQVNLGASYQLDSDWQLKLKVSDVFDKEPETIANYFSAGRQLFLTVNYANF